MVNIRSTLQFLGQRARTGGSSLLILTALLSLGLGCQARSAPPKLSKEEGLLVADLVQLHRLEILEGTRPAAADSLRRTLQATLDGPSLDERIRRLGEDPARGAVLLRAVRDSMTAMRGELFQTSAASIDEAPQPRTPEVQATLPADGDRDDED